MKVLALLHTEENVLPKAALEVLNTATSLGNWPTSVLLYVVGRAWAASSITRSPCLRAMAKMASMSQASPP